MGTELYVSDLADTLTAPRARRATTYAQEEGEPTTLAIGEEGDG